MYSNQIKSPLSGEKHSQLFASSETLKTHKYEN